MFPNKYIYQLVQQKFKQLQKDNTDDKRSLGLDTRRKGEKTNHGSYINMNELSGITNRAKRIEIKGEGR